MIEEKYKDTLSILINEELKLGGVFCFTVSTLSMFPMIRPKDEIVIKKSSLDSLKYGDIVVFEKDREFYTHRLLYKKKSGPKVNLITKGDNSLMIDEPFSEEEFLGKVIAVKRSSKFLNLESKFWRVVNRWVGTLSYLEWITYNVLRKLKRKLLSYSCP